MQSLKQGMQAPSRAHNARVYMIQSMQRSGHCVLALQFTRCCRVLHSCHWPSRTTSSSLCWPGGWPAHRRQLFGHHQRGGPQGAKPAKCQGILQGALRHASADAKVVHRLCWLPVGQRLGHTHGLASVQHAGRQNLACSKRQVGELVHKRGPAQGGQGAEGKGSLSQVPRRSCCWEVLNEGGRDVAIYSPVYPRRSRQGHHPSGHCL